MARRGAAGTLPLLLLAVLLVLPLLFIGVAAQRTPPPPANTVTLRIAVLPGLFTTNNATDLEAYLLATYNTSAKIVFEDQPSDESAYLKLITQVYLPALSYDAYMVDMLWTNELGSSMVNLAANFSDLCPYQPGVASAADCDFIEHLISPYAYGTAGDTYTAVPLYADSAVLYYRSDLTTKYEKNITQPPYETYDDLITAATIIMNGERALSTDSTRVDISGYLFQGASGDELTALALEIINANGGGALVDSNGRVSLNNDYALAALYNMTRWIGGVTPTSVVFKTDDTVSAAFEACHAPFMRNVPEYLASISMRCAGFPVLNLTSLPVASALAGWGLSVPNNTPTRNLAIGAVRFLSTSFQQSELARRFSVMPTRRSALVSMCLDPITNQTISTFYGCSVVTGGLGGTGMLYQPIEASKGQYPDISTYFSTWVNQQLTTRPDYDTLQKSLEAASTDLGSILSSAEAGDFCGFVNGVDITCADGLTCVNSECFNFTPLIYGLAIPLGLLLIALVAYILLLHWRKKNGGFQWGSYSIAWSDIQQDDKPIGRGTFGIVYHGRYRNTEVAIKRIINQDRASEVVKDFKAETKMLVSLRHPNIVLFMGACFDHTNLAIVTEWMPKGSLHSVLHDARIPLDFSIRMRMLRDIACGMAFLHAAAPPILHRDLKSPNILVDQDLRLKVSDFGLTVFKDAKPPKKKKESNKSYEEEMPFKGSLFWCAPEVMRNLPYTEKSDVYSFGIMMWEVLTRENLYPGLHPLSVGYKVMVEDLRPDIPEECPDHLAVLMRQCWHVDELVRPSFKDLLNTFEGLASPYLSQFINNLKEFQEMNRKARHQQEQLDELSALDVIAPEVEGPTGRITLVIADLEHWSKLWDTLAPSMNEVIRLYSTLLRQNMRKCRGFEVTLEGRSCVVAFSDVHMAARWALTTQADLMQVPWPVELEQSPLCRVESVDGHVIFKGLRVRMGIHTGEPTVSLNPLTRRAVYTGPVVNKAWRVCFTSDGGQILMSTDATDLLHVEEATIADLQAKVEYVGEYQLSQAEEPEPLAALSSAELAGRRFDAQMTDIASEASSSNVSDFGLSVAQWSIPPEEIAIEGDAIGRGSIGEVFLGSWKGMRVAIKRIYRKDYPPAMLLALSAEVSVLFQLRHPNLLLFLGASIGPDTFCIVSEFMDRGPLRPMLLDSHARPDLETRLRMIQDVAMAFRYLHSFNPPILHRNLKSTNIMVNSGLQVKVSDFGMSSVRLQAASMTMAADDYWTAPEVILGHEATVASDVYSFAIVMWEVLACEIPFQQPGAKGRFIDWVPLVVDGTRPFVPERAPAWCRTLIQACWDGNPRRRPSFAVIAETCFQKDTADLAMLVGVPPPASPHGNAPGAAAAAAAFAPGAGVGGSSPSALNANVVSGSGPSSPLTPLTALGAAAQGSGQPPPTPPSGSGSSLGRAASTARTGATAATAGASLTSNPSSRRRAKNTSEDVQGAPYGSSGSIWNIGAFRQQKHRTLEQHATVSARDLEIGRLDVGGSGDDGSPQLHAGPSQPSPQGSSGSGTDIHLHPPPSAAAAAFGFSATSAGLLAVPSGGDSAATTSGSEETLSSNPDRSATALHSMFAPAAAATAATAAAGATSSSLVSDSHGHGSLAHTGSSSSSSSGVGGSTAAQRGSMAEPVAGLPTGLPSTAVNGALRELLHASSHGTLPHLPPMGSSAMGTNSHAHTNGSAGAAMGTTAVRGTANAPRHSMPAALGIPGSQGPQVVTKGANPSSSAPASELPSPVNTDSSLSMSQPSSSTDLVVSPSQSRRQNPRKVHQQRLHSAFKGGEVVVPVSAAHPSAVRPLGPAATAAAAAHNPVAEAPTHGDGAAKPAPRVGRTTNPTVLSTDKLVGADPDREARRRQIIAEARQFLGLTRTDSAGGAAGPGPGTTGGTAATTTAVASAATTVAAAPAMAGAMPRASVDVRESGGTRLIKALRPARMERQNTAPNLGSQLALVPATASLPGPSSPTVDERATVPTLAAPAPPNGLHEVDGANADGSSASKPGKSPRRSPRATKDGAQVVDASQGKVQASTSTASTVEYGSSSSEAVSVPSESELAPVSYIDSGMLSPAARPSKKKKVKRATPDAGSRRETDASSGSLVDPSMEPTITLPLRGSPYPLDELAHANCD